MADFVYKKMLLCIPMFFLAFVYTSDYCSALQEGSNVYKRQLRRPGSNKWTKFRQPEERYILEQFLNNHRTPTKMIPSQTYTSILHRKERNPRQKKFARVPGMFNRMFAAFQSFHQMVANNFTSSTTVSGPPYQITQAPGVNRVSKVPPSRTRRRFPNMGYTRKPGGSQGMRRMRPESRKRPGGLRRRPGLRGRRPGGLKGKPGLRRKTPGRPDMRLMRPGGFTGKPGMRRMRPGGFTRKPGMRRMRPGGFTGNPGMRRMRPGGFTRKPGMRRMRPGGFTRKPGMRRMRPGGFTGKPGMRRIRPGGFTRKPGMRRMRPGGFTGKPGLRKMRPGGFTGKPGMWRMRPGGFTRKPGMRKMRPGGFPRKPGLRRMRPGGFTRKPGMRRIRPGGFTRRPGMRRIRPGGVTGRSGISKMRPGGVTGRPGMRKIRPKGFTTKPKMLTLRPDIVLRRPVASLTRKTKPSTRGPRIKPKLKPDMITASTDRLSKHPGKIDHRPKHVKTGKNVVTSAKSREKPASVDRRPSVKTKQHASHISKEILQTDKTGSKPAACQRPQHVSNGHFTSMSKYHHGSKITYTCKNGYKLEGIATHICQLDGQWSGDVPSCVVNEKQRNNLKGSLKKLSEDITNVGEAPNGKTFIVALIMVAIAILLIICHCFRVCKTRSKLSKKHKEVVEEGLVPTRDVPGLCEVSNGLLKKCCCCGGKSGLSTSFRPHKSRSRSGVASTRHAKGDRVKSSSKTSVRSSRHGSLHRTNSKASRQAVLNRDDLDDDETGPLVKDEFLQEDDFPSPPNNFFTDYSDVNDNSLSSYWNDNDAFKHRRRTVNCRPKTIKQKGNLPANLVTTPERGIRTDKRKYPRIQRKSSTRQREIISPMEHEGNMFVTSRRKAAKYKSRKDEGVRCKRDKIYRTYRYDNLGNGNTNSNGIVVSPAGFFLDSIDGRQELRATWNAIRNVVDKDRNTTERQGQSGQSDHDNYIYTLTDTETVSGKEGRPFVNINKLSFRNFSNNFSPSDVEDGLTYGIYKTRFDLDSRNIPVNQNCKDVWYLQKSSDHDFHGEIVHNDCDSPAHMSGVDETVNIDMNSKNVESFNYPESERADDHLIHLPSREHVTQNKAVFCTPKLTDVSPPSPACFKMKDNNYNCSSTNTVGGLIRKFNSPGFDQISSGGIFVSDNTGSIKDTTAPNLELMDIISGAEIKNEFNQDVAPGNVTHSDTKDGKIVDLQNWKDRNSELMDEIELPKECELDISDSDTLTVASARSPGLHEDDSEIIE